MPVAPAERAEARATMIDNAAAFLMKLKSFI
jgi:hypothetical protein